MGEIADMMISGIMCECCGVFLECDECEELGIPAYCSKECARDRGADLIQVCTHLQDNLTEDEYCDAFIRFMEKIKRNNEL